MQRVCVIGAGAAGLCAARYLSAKPNLFEPVVFEKSNCIGGTWVYTEDTGADKYGLPIHSSMYKNLKTNLPKEIMAFPDLAFDPSLPSFITHEDVLHYLEQYAVKFNVHKYIKFETLVECIKPITNGKKTRWEVIVGNLKDNKESAKQTGLFDAVIVCNGHNSVPKMPKLEGQETFKGDILHSHCYRKPEDFNNSTVVCVGAGNSGQDIVLDLHTHAKTIYFSHWESLTSVFPHNILQVPPIDYLHGKTVTFTDNQSCKADHIMLCTGYEYTFPFLTEECHMIVEDQRISPLYKHTFHTEYPSLCFICMPYNTVPFPQISCQVRLAVAFLDGSFRMPSKEEMEFDIKKDSRRRFDMGWPHRHSHKMDSLQWDYYSQLAQLGNFDPIPRVLQGIYKENEFQRRNNVWHFKELNYEIVDELHWRKVDDGEIKYK